jgi:beta-lactamase regulating signal transducer with metallopeptidase domain
VRVLALWAFGAIAVGLWLAAGELRARWVVRLGTRLENGRVHAIVQSLRRRIALDARVSVLRSDRVRTPVTLGVIQPLLIVPPEAERWSTARLRAVALHELHHIRRYDCLTQRAADLACALYWFHPAVWYSARRLRIERERACDDCVIRSGIRPSRYARHLLDIARAATTGVPAPAIAMTQKSGFEERVEAILDPDIAREPPSRLGFAVAALLVASIVLPLAALDPWRDAAAPVTAGAAPTIGATHIPHATTRSTARPTLANSHTANGDPVRDAERDVVAYGRAPVTRPRHPLSM